MNQSNENHLRETEEILRDCPITRDDDTLLILRLWKKFHPSELNRLMLANTDEELAEAFRALPKEDSIKRYRRTLRERYPCSEEMELKRRQEERESKHYWSGNQATIFKPLNPHFE